MTCWIALTDATVENGCMEVMPGVWKQGYREHQAEGGTTIRPDLLPDSAAAPGAGRQGRDRVHAPLYAASLHAELQPGRALEHRPALSADRAADGPPLPPGLCRPQPQPSRKLC